MRGTTKWTLALGLVGSSWAFDPFNGKNPLKSLQALPAEMTRNLGRQRLREAARSRSSTPPERMDAARAEKMVRMGFEWDSTTKQWKHTGRAKEFQAEAEIFESARVELLEEDYAVDEEAIYDDVKSIFAEDFGEVEARYEQSYRKRKFRGKPLADAAADVASAALDPANVEMAERLGFVFDESKQRWSRGAPRKTFRTVTVQVAGDARKLKVKARSDVEMMAVNRLEYLLSRTLLDEPENVAQGATRVVRDPLFVFYWAVAQTKITEEWTSFDMLKEASDQFSTTPSDNNAIVSSLAANHLGLDALAAALGSTQDVEVAAGLTTLFLAAHVASRALWARSSGAAHIDGLERAMADTVAGNRTLAPFTWAWRQDEGGLLWRVAFGFLSACAALPRVEAVHAYAQPKLEALFRGTASLDAVMDGPEYYSLYAAATAVVGVTVLAAIAETWALRYARPPRTADDELASIASELTTDALNVRFAAKAAKAARKNAKRQDQDLSIKGIFTLETAEYYSKSSAEKAEAFDAIVTAWCDAFHEGRKTPKNSPESFAVKAVGLAGARTATAATAYALTGGSLAAPVALHALAAASELAPIDADGPNGSAKARQGQEIEFNFADTDEQK